MLVDGTAGGLIESGDLDVFRRRSAEFIIGRKLEGDGG
jgi:hypothetical protein